MWVQWFFLQITMLTSAGTLQTYQEREKAFLEWRAEQEKLNTLRKSAADQQRMERARREIDALRRRQQFRREVRTTGPLENDHLAKVERLEAQRLATRDLFAQNRKALLDFYEKNVLPLKIKEYDLETPPPTEDKK